MPPLAYRADRAFPTAVAQYRTSITFNFAGIFGTSLALYATTRLQTNCGMAHVGYCLLGPAVIMLRCVIASGRAEV